MFSLGIDIGHSAIKTALLDTTNEIAQIRYIRHNGRVLDTLVSSLEAFISDSSNPGVGVGALTGNTADLLDGERRFLIVNDIEALVEGSLWACKEAGSVISIGCQSAVFVTGIAPGKSSRLRVQMNDDCASGTGAFLEEQVSRLGMSLEDFASQAKKAASIPRIAGRCSVFAKTDITHYLQEGVPIADVLKGLAYAVAKSFRGSLIKRQEIEKPVVFAGGVALNRAVTAAFEDILKLKEGEMVVPTASACISAIGAASVAKRHKSKIDFTKLLRALQEAGRRRASVSITTGLSPLTDMGQDDSENKHICVSSHPEVLYLGIDVGSTSTNLVLIGPNREIVDYTYLRTKGNPINALFHGVQQLSGLLTEDSRIAGIGVTGSGRHIIAKHLGTGSVLNEITAQAKATMLLDDSIDTIFEIGGQDSKFICLKDGRVSDFKMNKVCAAGTGSFIEEQAKKLGIPIEDFGRLALTGLNPPDLGERCTVFIETSIASYLSRGAELRDIASGLCYAVANNYLHRVVGNKSLGEKIAFQGGVAFNQGVVNAFRELTKKKIVVPPFFSVSGAFGAAVFAMETGPRDGYLKGEAYIRGGKSFVDSKPSCSSRATKQAGEYTHRMEQLVFEGYDDVIETGKRTVGIPRALYAFGMFPMFHAFFRNLGLNVMLSGRSNDETIRLSQEYAVAETCYPVKLILGHVAELIKRKVDFIFFPDLYTVEHPGSHTRQDFGCPYMQLAFKIVDHAMGLQNKGIQMLSPTIAFSLGSDFMQESFHKVGQEFGKSPAQVNVALKAGMDAFHAFENRMVAHGNTMLRDFDSEEKVFIIVSKTYGVVDPILTMRIPEKLMALGHSVLPFFHLPDADISSEHPNMYWPFGKHILEAAKVIKEKPNLYAILLTHHCCGPDSVLQHYFAEMMGNKPFLNIEVDEHASDVGVTTRIEAFLDSLKKTALKEDNSSVQNERYPGAERGCRLISSGAWQKHSRIFLPHLFPYSEIFAAILKSRGFDAGVLPPTDSRSIALGRQHTQTNEYLSLTALLGDVLARVENGAQRGHPLAFLLPQNEGAEVDGQYSRFVKSVLDRLGYEDVEILSPFIEEVFSSDESISREVLWGLLAGDILKQWPMRESSDILGMVTDLVYQGRLDIGALEMLASDVQMRLDKERHKNAVLVLGEPLVLFNGHLSGSAFSTIEKNGRRVMWLPLSETMWLTWRDYLQNNISHSTEQQRKRLNVFELWIKRVSAVLAEHSPFASDLQKLLAVADQNLGYYAGAFGRYRFAKAYCAPKSCAGVVSVASTYENTEIAIGLLQRALPNHLPTLSLSFDGDVNDKNTKMIEAFLHYL